MVAAVIWAASCKPGYKLGPFTLIYFKYGSWGPSCGQAWPWVCALGCLWKLFCDHPLGPDAQEQFEMPLLAFCCVLIDSGDVGQGVNGRR